MDWYKTKRSFKVGEKVWLLLNKERLHGLREKKSRLYDMVLLRHWKRLLIIPIISIYPHTSILLANQFQTPKLQMSDLVTRLSFISCIPYLWVYGWSLQDLNMGLSLANRFQTLELQRLELVMGLAFIA